MSDVFSALKELPLGGLTYYESKGRGEVPTSVLHIGSGTSVYRSEFNVNVTISVVVKDPMVNEVINGILQSPSAGFARKSTE